MELLILSIPGMYKDRWYLLQVPNKQVLPSKSSTADLTSFSPSFNSSNSSTVMSKSTYLIKNYPVMFPKGLQWGNKYVFQRSPENLA